MIWIWINSVIVFLLKLLIPPVIETVVPTINPNTPCPGCGHRQGKITAVQNQLEVVIRHDCAVCKAIWYENTIVSSKMLQAHPQKG